MDTTPLEEARKLIGQYLDANPVEVPCCETCRRPLPEARPASQEREMLTAAIARLRRVIDHQKYGGIL